MFHKMFVPVLAFGLAVSVSAAPQPPPAQNPQAPAQGQPSPIVVWVPHTIAPVGVTSISV